MNKLIYLPIEPYVERYTWFMSSPGGWAEHHFSALGVKYVRIDGYPLGNTIKNGVVLDACGRSYYATSQIQQVVKMIDEGKVADGDVIYTEDFWHSGIDALFYIRELTGIKFKIGCFLHAQTVDEHDFTYGMREWMRPIEQGYGKQYDFIFTCSDILRNRLLEAGICKASVKSNVYTVGLPYNSVRLKEQLALDYQTDFSSVEKEDYVIFSSRFDTEKNPNFFLDLVERCSNIKFVLVNPRKDRPITNDQEALKRVHFSKPLNLQVIDTTNKRDYYELLAGAKVQFNCAKQDWVSWTLLEAVTWKCLPLYPRWRDFPVELDNDTTYLYDNCDLDSAEAKLRRLMLSDGFDESLNRIVEKHDNSWHNYLQIMGLL